MELQPANYQLFPSNIAPAPAVRFTAQPSACGRRTRPPRGSRGRSPPGCRRVRSGRASDAVTPRREGWRDLYLCYGAWVRLRAGRPSGRACAPAERVGALARRPSGRACAPADRLVALARRLAKWARMRAGSLSGRMCAPATACWIAAAPSHRMEGLFRDPPIKFTGETEGC